MLEFILNGSEIKNIIGIEDSYMFLSRDKNAIIEKNNKKINMILIDHNVSQGYINKLSVMCNIIAVADNNSIFKIVVSKYTYPCIGDTIEVLSIQ